METPKPAFSPAAHDNKLETALRPVEALSDDTVELSPEHGRTFEYEYLSDPLIRMQYVQLTSELVDKVLAEKSDTLIFLDKSARPVYWLMKELWPLLASKHNLDDEKIETPPIPEVKFLNIDRGAWIKKTGGLEENSGTGVKVDHSTVGHDIEDLRATFFTDINEVSKRGGEFSKPTMFDGKKVMVIDEVKVSGNTLEIARQFMSKAFPEADIKVEHWMHPLIGSKGGSRFNSEVPIWYSDTTALGRGIGDLNVAANEQSIHPRIKRGKKFISRPLHKRDWMSDTLRFEFKQLVEEISLGKLPLRLNLTGIDKEDLDERIRFMEIVNYGVTARQLTGMLDQAKGRSYIFPQLYQAAKKPEF